MALINVARCVARPRALARVATPRTVAVTATTVVFLLALATAALPVASAVECNPLQIAQFREKFGKTPPCPEAELITVDAGCAKWYGAEGANPAPWAGAWALAAFGTCRANGDTPSPNCLSGPCDNVKAWCVSDYNLADSFAAPQLPNEASPLLSYCCCPAESSCWEHTKSERSFAADGQKAISS